MADEIIRNEVTEQDVLRAKLAYYESGTMANNALIEMRAAGAKGEAAIDKYNDCQLTNLQIDRDVRLREAEFNAHKAYVDAVTWSYFGPEEHKEAAIEANRKQILVAENLISIISYWRSKS